MSRPALPDKHFTATGFLVRDGKVLLVNHRKLKRWLPVGGHIEAGEDPTQALRREVREEVGLDIEIVADALPVDDDDVRGLPRPETILLETIEPGTFTSISFTSDTPWAASLGWPRRSTASSAGSRQRPWGQPHQ